MDDRSALLRMLKRALREAQGKRRPYAGLPRITVFDPPKRRKARVRYRTAPRERPSPSPPAQLELF